MSDVVEEDGRKYQKMVHELKKVSILVEMIKKELYDEFRHDGGALPLSDMETDVKSMWTAAKSCHQHMKESRENLWMRSNKREAEREHRAFEARLESNFSKRPRTAPTEEPVVATQQAEVSENPDLTEGESQRYLDLLNL